MKYFLDTEFLEGPQQEKFPISLFRKQTPPTIDLISIGIVAEDGREYYAISKDFNLEEAWNRFQLEEQSGDMRNIFPEGKKVYWIRQNVLLPIWRELFFKADLDNDIYSNKQADRFCEDVNLGGYDHYFSLKSLKALISKYGKTNKEIAEKIIDFTKPMYRNYSLEGENRFTHGSVGFGIDPLSEEDLNKYGYKYNYPPTNPEFYAYYADYDWVVFCWIFGKMIDLPDGFPMFCCDLKQILDEKAKKFITPYCIGENDEDIERMAERSISGQVESFKTFSNYPNQDPSKSHNAIEDARWNKKLFQFLKEI